MSVFYKSYAQAVGNHQHKQCGFYVFTYGSVVCYSHAMDFAINLP